MEFPLLDTAVSVQYTAAKERRVRHRAHEFLGDGRQSQIDRHSSGERWRLAYEELSASEVNRLRAFCEALQYGETFSFPDPWTGQVYAQCRLTDSAFLMSSGGSMRYRALLGVEDAS
jgi:hypothetical protein